MPAPFRPRLHLGQPMLCNKTTQISVNRRARSRRVQAARFLCPQGALVMEALRGRRMLLSSACITAATSSGTSRVELRSTVTSTLLKFAMVKQR